VAAAGNSPEEALLSRTMAPQLQQALESLPKALRDAVWLRDVEERSYAEIALHLRIPIGTVMSRISRGRRLLHDRLAAAQRQSR
jgi:RNA polymerase sigma-70 factor (ECF subfamily)